MLRPASFMPNVSNLSGTNTILIVSYFYFYLRLFAGRYLGMSQSFTFWNSLMAVCSDEWHAWCWNSFFFPPPFFLRGLAVHCMWHKNWCSIHCCHWCKLLLYSDMYLLTKFLRYELQSASPLSYAPDAIHICFFGLLKELFGPEVWIICWTPVSCPSFIMKISETSSSSGFMSRVYWWEECVELGK